MSNNYFNFKQFSINQERSAFKVGTDGVLLGASADLSQVKTILEIGCGTGLISLMLAQRCNAIITAIEPDFESFAEACENIGNSKWAERISILNTDIQSLDRGLQSFDLIVTNPPYFNDSLKNPDPRRSSARHNDSLTSEAILNSVTRFLKEDGHLHLIMPYVEGNVFIAEAAKYGLYCNKILKIKPLPTSDIRRLILTFSKVRTIVTEKFLTIEQGPRHEFTEEYINITKDFYLKF